MIDDSTYIVGTVNYVLFPGFTHTQMARMPADFIRVSPLPDFRGEACSTTPTQSPTADRIRKSRRPAKRRSHVRCMRTMLLMIAAVGFLCASVREVYRR